MIPSFRKKRPLQKSTLISFAWKPRVVEFLNTMFVYRMLNPPTCQGPRVSSLRTGRTTFAMLVDGFRRPIMFPLLVLVHETRDRDNKLADEWCRPTKPTLLKSFTPGAIMIPTIRRIYFQKSTISTRSASSGILVGGRRSITSLLFVVLETRQRNYKVADECRPTMQILFKSFTRRRMRYQS